MYPEQKIVKALDEESITEIAQTVDGKARAASLATLIRRSGLIQVLLWLNASTDDKRNTYRVISRLLERGISAVLGDTAATEPRKLAELPAAAYMTHQRVAMDVATLLSRLVDAHSPDSRAQDGADRDAR